MRPRHAVMMGSIALALVAAGCGEAIPSSNGGPVTLKLSSGYLVDTQGRSVYLFEKDEKGESYCYGACAAVWPPLETNKSASASAGVDSVALGTSKRKDGDLQVTYHGYPLYYYAGDASTPGKENGQQLNMFGAEWYLISAQGKPAESKGGKSGSSGGGGGYG